MFFRRHSSGPMISGRTPLERFLRTVGFFAVFAIAAWAFWLNNQRRIAQYSEEAAVKDPGQMLSESDRRLVRDFREALQERYGLNMRLSLGPGAATPQATDAKTLYLGLDPEARRAVLVLPPLLRRGLGEEFAAYLETEHFDPYFQAQDWAQGLRTALVLLWSRLESLEAGPAPAQTPAQPPAGSGQ